MTHRTSSRSFCDTKNEHRKKRFTDGEPPPSFVWDNIKLGVSGFQDSNKLQELVCQRII